MLEVYRLLAGHGLLGPVVLRVHWLLGAPRATRAHRLLEAHELLGAHRMLRAHRMLGAHMMLGAHWLLPTSGASSY